MQNIKGEKPKQGVKIERPKRDVNLEIPKQDVKVEKPKQGKSSQKSVPLEIKVGEKIINWDEIREGSSKRKDEPKPKAQEELQQKIEEEEEEEFRDSVVYEERWKTIKEYRDGANEYFYKFGNPKEEQYFSNLTNKIAKYNFCLNLITNAVKKCGFEKCGYPNDKNALVQYLKSQNNDRILSFICEIASFSKKNGRAGTYNLTADKIKNIFKTGISEKEEQKFKELSQILINDIIKDKQSEHLSPEYLALFEKVIKEYGANCYRNGEIAAQSINFVKSYNDKSLFWTKCGLGVFGRTKDTMYSNLISYACDAETMSGIRDTMYFNNIDTSSTPDEFAAVSAFMALNAKGTVFVASKEELPKGRYLVNSEIPILCDNPNVSEIKWINTNDDFLSKLDEAVLDSNGDLVIFQNAAKSIFENEQNEQNEQYVKTVFQRNPNSQINPEEIIKKMEGKFDESTSNDNPIDWKDILNISDRIDEIDNLLEIKGISGNLRVNLEKEKLDAINYLLNFRKIPEDLRGDLVTKRDEILRKPPCKRKKPLTMRNAYEADLKDYVRSFYQQRNKNKNINLE